MLHLLLLLSGFAFSLKAFIFMPERIEALALCPLLLLFFNFLLLFH